MIRDESAFSLYINKSEKKKKKIHIFVIALILAVESISNLATAIGRSFQFLPLGLWFIFFFTDEMLVGLHVSNFH